MANISVKTKKRSEMVDITRDVAALLPTDMKSGICHIFSMHTTAGLTVNENADPDVRHDIDSLLNKLVPWSEAGFRHFEGNSAAHIKASLMGFSQTVPVENGRLCLGTWQGIYFCEFDGPRNRSVNVQFLKDIQAS